MIASILLFASLAFAESKVLALQICLDRAGYSCNTIDGQWGRKSDRALRLYLAETGRRLPEKAWRNGAPDPDAAFDSLFGTDTGLFRLVTVTESDIASLVTIPADPADKARLPRMGYESIREMFAERGHLSQLAMERMNPGVDWKHVRPGLRLVIPDFPPMDEEFAAGERERKNRPRRPEAACIRISLSNFEITAWDAKGKCLGLFPCSIANSRAKLPPQGQLKVTSYVAHPNYTYTPDFTPPGEKVSRHIFPQGPNCPVGVAWLGLNLPGYGIHGTTRPESIGNAESHGCFRLANWNAARLYALCRTGTRVIIER